MEVQVLVAAMNQKDHSLLEKMNIDSDVIVGNQCNFDSVERFEYKKHKATYLNFCERGVGLNRNNALMRASGKYCLFADDDMVYVDNYTEIVEKAFEQHPNADVIVFNIFENTPTRYIIKKEERVFLHNYLRYGTARIAIRLSSIRNNGIFFHLCFGGGTDHCHGEDNIFLSDCLKKKLRIIAVPQTIATLTEQRPSTWNSGYNEKYLTDQGMLYKTISRKFWIMLCLQDAMRHSRKYYKIPWFKAFRLMVFGGDSREV